MRHKPSSPFPRALAAGIVAISGLASSALAETRDVPVGGAAIAIDGGSQNIGIQVKNKTGKTAKDITVHVFHPDGEEIPDITGIDVTGSDKDTVDDNGDGKIEGDDEGDTTDSSPGSTCSSIFGGSVDVENNGEIDVTVTFSGPTPEGTKIRVKFSEEKGGIHRDICMNGAVNPGGLFEDEWGGGRALCSATVSNVGLEMPIGAFEIWLGDASDNAFRQLQLPAPFEIVDMDLQGNRAFLQFFPPLMPGGCMDLLVDFELDLHEGTGIGLLPLPAPPPCPGDFNGDGVVNTIDVIDFLNAWTAGCG